LRVLEPHTPTFFVSGSAQLALSLVFAYPHPVQWNRHFLFNQAINKRARRELIQLRRSIAAATTVRSRDRSRFAKSW
jgi:hypothetical protein